MVDLRLIAPSLLESEQGGVAKGKDRSPVKFPIAYSVFAIPTMTCRGSVSWGFGTGDPVTLTGFETYVVDDPGNWKVWWLSAGI